MIYLNRSREISQDEWHQILSELDLLDKLKSARTIAVKPNFAAGTYVDPKTHVMSDLYLLRSFIEYIGTENEHAQIYIVESDSTGNGFAYLKFERLGLPDSLNISGNIAERVHCLDLTRDRLRLIDIRNEFRTFNTVDKQLLLSEQLLDMDFLVSLSNLKMHSVTGYTGACKNLFGCLPAFDKSVYHPRIHKVIHDLVLTLMPDLNIVDAFYGMERNGPVQGIDKDSGYRVISNDAVEADDYAAASVGINPENIEYLKLLHKTQGTQRSEFDGIITKYRKPQIFLRMMNRVGLSIQGIGAGIESFGHRVHTCYSPLVLGIVIVRPILVRLIDINTLKHIKQKVFKKYL